MRQGSASARATVTITCLRFAAFARVPDAQRPAAVHLRSSCWPKHPRRDRLSEGQLGLSLKHSCILQKEHDSDFPGPCLEDYARVFHHFCRVQIRQMQGLLAVGDVEAAFGHG